MKNLLRASICLAVFLLTIVFPAPAQKLMKPKYEMGARLSCLVYQGDLATSPLGSYGSPGPGAGIFGTWIMDWSWSLRVSADYGTFKADDAAYESPSWRRQRNFSFSTSLLEVSAQMLYTIGDNYTADRLQPYVFAGAGVSFLKVNRDYSHSDPSYFSSRDWLMKGLRADSEAELPKRCLVFPVGAGFRFGIGDYMSLYGEGTYRLMSTDYLDGFSRAANPSLLDHYTNLSIGVIYRFGDNFINCPRY
jgi:hypothetical protein